MFGWRGRGWASWSVRERCTHPDGWVGEIDGSKRKNRPEESGVRRGGDCDLSGGRGRVVGAQGGG